MESITLYTPCQLLEQSALEIANVSIGSIPIANKVESRRSMPNTLSVTIALTFLNQAALKTFDSLRRFIYTSLCK